MHEILPVGSNLFTSSFTLRMAQSVVEDFVGRPVPDSEYSFDGFKISGFEDMFGSERRYVRPVDKEKIFDLILGG